MLTPYEFGRQTGRLQARINREISEERIAHLAEILAIEEPVSFAEGYKNGFEEKRIEEREARIDEAYLEMVEDEAPPWLPNAAELEADEVEAAAREINYPWATRGVEFGTVDGMINSSTWKSYLQGKFDR